MARRRLEKDRECDAPKRRFSQQDALKQERPSKKNKSERSDKRKRVKEERPPMSSSSDASENDDESSAVPDNVATAVTTDQHQAIEAVGLAFGLMLV